MAEAFLEWRSEEGGLRDSRYGIFSKGLVAPFQNDVAFFLTKEIRMMPRSFLKSLAAAAALFSLSLAVARPLLAEDLDDWINLQSGRSRTFLEANISPKYAAHGAVVAAPSFQHPQY